MRTTCHRHVKSFVACPAYPLPPARVKCCCDEREWLHLCRNELTFAAGDATLPSFWNLAVKDHMTKGEVAELSIHYTAAYGDEGAPSLGVPPFADVVLTVTLVDWVVVDDVSAQRDGSILKRLLIQGEGWERAAPLYECTIDFEVRLAPEAPVIARVDGALITLGSVSRCERVASLSSLTGGANVAVAIEKLVPLMQMHETSELRCVPSFVGLAAAKRVTWSITARQIKSK